MNKSVNLIFLAAFAFGAYAQSNVEPHSQNDLSPAPECIVPALTNLYGQRISGSYKTDVRSKSEIGKEYQEGAVVYYKEYKDAEKFYYFQDEIKIVNPSPLNRNYIFRVGDKFITKFSFRAKAGKVYDIISGDDIVWFAVDEDGYICSGGYVSGMDWSLNNLFKYTVPPHNRLRSKIEQTKNQSQANLTKAIAIQLLKIDELQLSLQTSQIVDDKIVGQRKFSVNAMKGIANLGEVEIRFHQKDGKLLIDEINELISSDRPQK